MLWLLLDASIINLSLCASVLGFGGGGGSSGILTQRRCIGWRNSFIFPLSGWISSISVLCCPKWWCRYGARVNTWLRRLLLWASLISHLSSLTLCSYLYFPSGLKIPMFQPPCDFLQVWARISAPLVLLAGKKFKKKSFSSKCFVVMSNILPAHIGFFCICSCRFLP